MTAGPMFKFNETLVDNIVVDDSIALITPYFITLSETIVATDLVADNLSAVLNDEIINVDTIIEVQSYVDVLSDLIDSVDVGGGDLSNFFDTLVDSTVLSDTIVHDSFVGNPELMIWAKYLPKKFIQVPVISDFLNAVWIVFGSDIRNTLERLRNIRNPELFDLELSERLAATLGFSQDLDNLDDLDKRRLVSSLVGFYERLGTKFTFDFLSFISSQKFSIVPLYTQDYISFFQQPQDTLEPEGNWYLTTHVDIDIQSDNLDVEDVATRFYDIAPVPLIIRFIGKQATEEITLEIQGYIHTEYNEFSSTEFITL
jgi:hypothetical protein